MRSLRINGEGELRGQPANSVSLGKMAVCVYIVVLSFCVCVLLCVSPIIIIIIIIITRCRRETATICPGPVTLTFDLLTLKVASESRVRVTWPTYVPILVFLALSVLELGPMYATDRQTDVRQHHPLVPPPRGRGIIISSGCGTGRR